jgi:RNA polymerase sigma factor (sigma-70 family)
MRKREGISIALGGVNPPRPAFGDGRWSEEDERLSKEVFDLFLRRLRNLLRVEEIEDLAQEVLLRLHRRAVAGRPVRNALGWGWWAASRRALDVLRRSGRERAACSLESVDESRVVRRGGGPPAYDEDERAALHRAVALLRSEPERRVIEGYLRGDGRKRIAEGVRGMALSPGMVSYHLANGKKRLRRMLLPLLEGRPREHSRRP